jgi:hypothetical protein
MDASTANDETLDVTTGYDETVTMDEESHKRKAEDLDEDDSQPCSSKCAKHAHDDDKSSVNPSCHHHRFYEYTPIPSTQCAKFHTDPSYYFEDGNVILLVYDTYFKVSAS